MTTLTPELAQGLDSLLDDPVEFKYLVSANTYSKQDEMTRAVFTSPRVTVSGANGTGKDFQAARIALAWLTLLEPAKVVVIAPTHRQVEDIFWNEMRAAFRSKAFREPWGLKMFPGSARVECLYDAEEHFGVGFATKDKAAGVNQMPTGEGLQGYHSPNLLAIISEAHAVQQAHIDEIRRLNPRCTLMTGNPFTASGEFYDSHHSKRHLYQSIQISAFDTPNLRDIAPEEGYADYPGMVTKKDVRERAEEWGEDNPLYIAGVKGEFPDNLDDMVIVPLYAAQAAAQRTSEPSGTVRVACDVARYGADKTVVMRRQGDHAEIVHSTQGADLMKTTGFLKRYIMENLVDELVVDETGLGSGVVDRLRELGTGRTRLVGFNFGGSPKDKDRFVNAGAECYWAMRQWCMEEPADIPNSAPLLSGMSGRLYSIDSRGRTKLQPKEEMHRSPDEADALAMTFVQDKGRPGVRFLE